MDAFKFEINNKKITLYPAAKEGAGLVVLHEYEGDGSGVLAALSALDCPPINLLVISGLAWDDDMTPWPCEPLFAGDSPCGGRAEEYLALLLGEILPRARLEIKGEIAWTGVAGYSLAGLFALWSLYRADEFSRAASMSGSLWYPRFAEFAASREFVRKPDKLYLSLGDAEERSKNPVLRTVRERSQELARLYRAARIATKWELNPGNHFKNIALRTAKGLAYLARD